MLPFRLRGRSKAISSARLYSWGLARAFSLSVAQFALLPLLEQGQGGLCLYRIMQLTERAYSCSGTENTGVTPAQVPVLITLLEVRAH